MRRKIMILYLWAVMVYTLAVACQGPSQNDKENRSHIDNNIPASEEYNASYGFWGPDGNHIYYQHSEELGSNPDARRLDQLWKLNLETGNRQKIRDGRILNADISPNGQWIVFHSFTLPQYLYKMRSDGTELQKLTGPNSPNPEWEYTVMGKWAPDGDQILFSVYAGESRGVSLIEKNGTDPRIIVPYGVQPNWFPDGEQIIYLNWDTTKTSDDQLQIYSADSAGHASKRITDFNESSWKINNPSKSPGSDKITFAFKGKGFNSEVFIVKSDGSGFKQLTEGPGYVRRPEWSPDGETILFTRIIENVSERLYFLDVATLEVTPVFPAE
jgi:Tol biopolymer transport system component